VTDQDFAIVVGIARYRDHEKYPPLDGPLNDVERVVTWLQHPAGGGITDTTRIISLQTPKELLPAPPPDGWPEGTQWHPNRTLFSEAFDGVTLDKKGEFIRRSGRLYLYFSGHGFSQQADQAPSAALYGADNIGKKTGNLAGTLYAQAAKQANLFKEVVLIMDCCRDAESNVAYSPPDLNKVENDGSENVQLFAVYAAPKRGKAQERELEEPGGKKVVGLLTTGWLRALREAPCDVLGRVPGRSLTQYIAFTWKSWYPVQTPPMPRFIVPETGDLYFNSGKPLVDQLFRVPALTPDQARFRLTSNTLNAGAVVTGPDIAWQDANNAWAASIPLIDAGDGSRSFTLKLPPVEHTLFRDALPQEVRFTPGGADAVSL
jgi:hypothetical protein